MRIIIAFFCAVRSNFISTDHKYNHGWDIPDENFEPVVDRKNFLMVSGEKYVAFI